MGIYTYKPSANALLAGTTEVCSECRKKYGFQFFYKEVKKNSIIEMRIFNV
jgi:hypothetical protein